MKLFCIPHAGGSTLSYLPWKKHLNDHITFVPLDLPGHMPRNQEPICHDVKDAVEDLYQSLKNNLQAHEKYAIFGHSMGGMLLYFLYFRLVEDGCELPEHLFFSSRWPPYHDNPKAYFNLDNEEESKQRLIKMGGFNEVLVHNKPMLDYYMGVLLADYRLIQSTPAVRAQTIYSDMTAMWSDNEPDIADEDIYSWKRSAGSRLTFVKMSGTTHFFPTEEPLKTVNVINTTLQKYKESGICP
ncbi:thioesterase II family protein [Paenibacillus kobensis]|uniref:thioesterase II family protein n=1 Tax=Paenibacillus kobensis TaxID=59841 RepID=UPI000FDBB67B|nr:alpha/beta fold hydrolase [Paenibacillus kobensis]